MFSLQDEMAKIIIWLRWLLKKIWTEWASNQLLKFSWLFDCKVLAGSGT